MYNFVTRDIWNDYLFHPTNDTVSLDASTFIFDGSGWDMCGHRIYNVEALTGGSVTHSQVENELGQQSLEPGEIGLRYPNV